MMTVTHLNGEIYQPGDTITLANGREVAGIYRVTKVIDECTIEVDGPEITLRDYNILNKELKIVADPRIPEEYGVLTMSTLTESEVKELYELIKSQAMIARENPIVLSTGTQCVYLGKKTSERKKNFKQKQAMRKAKASW